MPEAPGISSEKVGTPNLDFITNCVENTGWHTLSFFLWVLGVGFFFFFRALILVCHINHKNVHNAQKKILKDIFQ